MFGFRFTLGRFIRTIAKQKQTEEGDRAASVQIPYGGHEEKRSSMDNTRSEYQ